MRVHSPHARLPGRQGALAGVALVATAVLAGGRPAAGQAARPAPASQGAARSVTIVTPEEGEHFVRFLPSADAAAKAQLPLRFTDREKTIPIPPGIGKSPRIAVDNARTGNTAIVPLGSGGRIELHRIDFGHVRRVEVRVVYEGRPVQAAVVTLAAKGAPPQTVTLDPVMAGVAPFDDVPAGKARLTIVYGDRFTETKDLEITTDHPERVLRITAPVTNKVPTVEPPSAAPAAVPPGGAPPAQPLPGATPPARDEGGGIAGLLGSLLGIALVGGGIYLLYRWSQSGGMAATLKKAGIEVSGPAPPSDAGTPWQPNAPPPPVVADPSLCPFCGQKKDAAGGCACAVGTGAPGAAAVPSQPRLVATMGAYSGSIFPLALNGAGITIGREPTNAIALTNDTTVSRRHASIRMENGTCTVTDEGSSNGVFVNGVRISGSQDLRPGDELQIGNTRFRFEM